jgi:hypothetical protein
VTFCRAIRPVEPKKANPKEAEGEPRTQNDTPKNKGTLRGCKHIRWMQIIFILLVLASRIKGQPMEQSDNKNEMEMDEAFYKSFVLSIAQIIKDNSTTEPYKFIASTNSNF